MHWPDQNLSLLFKLVTSLNSKILRNTATYLGLRLLCTKKKMGLWSISHRSIDRSISLSFSQSRFLGGHEVKTIPATSTREKLVNLHEITGEWFREEMGFQYWWNVDNDSTDVTSAGIQVVPDSWTDNRESPVGDSWQPDTRHHQTASVTDRAIKRSTARQASDASEWLCTPERQSWTNSQPVETD